MLNAVAKRLHMLSPLAEVVQLVRVCRRQFGHFGACLAVIEPGWPDPASPGGEGSGLFASVFGLGIFWCLWFGCQARRFTADLHFGGEVREYGWRWVVDQCGGDVLCVRGCACLALDPLRDFGTAAVAGHGRVPFLTAAQGVQLGVKAAVVFDRFGSSFLYMPRVVQ